MPNRFSVRPLDCRFKNMGKKPFLSKMDVGHRPVFSRNTAEEDIGTCLSPWSKTKRQFLLEKSDTLEEILYRMRSITKDKGSAMQRDDTFRDSIGISHFLLYLHQWSHFLHRSLHSQMYVFNVDMCTRTYGYGILEDLQMCLFSRAE